MLSDGKSMTLYTTALEIHGSSRGQTVGFRELKVGGVVKPFLCLLMRTLLDAMLSKQV